MNGKRIFLILSQTFVNSNGINSFRNKFILDFYLFKLMKLSSVFSLSIQLETCSSKSHGCHLKSSESWHNTSQINCSLSSTLGFYGLSLALYSANFKLNLFLYWSILYFLSCFLLLDFSILLKS